MITQNESIYDQVAAMLSAMQVGDHASDHVAELNAFQGWNYVAIQALCKQAARAIPRVYSDSCDGASVTVRKSLRLEHGIAWRKALRPGENPGELVPNNHPLLRILDQPNPKQTGSAFRWEQIQQLRIHGSCIVWNRPNVARTRTVERYVIPMALITPVAPGMHPKYPRGGIKILPYRSSLYRVAANDFAPLRPFYGAILSIDQLSIARYPHPMLKGDGASPTNAIANWIDTGTLIDQTRVQFYGEGSQGKLIFTADTSDPDQVEQIERKLNDMVGPDGKQVVVIGTNATLALKRTAEELGFTESYDQMRNGVLAGHGVAKPQIGEHDGMTYGSLAASLFASNYLSIQPDMDLIADEDTRDLAKDYPGKLTIEYDIPNIENPEFEMQRTENAAAKSVLRVREYRNKQNLEPFGNELDDYILTPQGPVPMSSLIKSATTGPTIIPPAPQPAQDAQGIAIRRTMMEDYPDSELTILRKAGFRLIDVDMMGDHDMLWDPVVDGPLTMFATRLPDSLQKSQLEALLSDTAEHKYGCIMLELPQVLADSVLSLGLELPDELLGPGGREAYPHLTVLYGIAGATLEEVIDRLRRMEAPLVTFRQISTFPAGKDGVPVKIDIESPQAAAMNAALRETLPHTVTFAEYRPHVTVAYAQDGVDVSGLFSSLTGKSVRLTKAVISMPGKPKAIVPLREPTEIITPPTIPSAEEAIAKALGYDKSKEQLSELTKRMTGLESDLKTIIAALQKS